MTRMDGGPDSRTPGAGPLTARRVISHAVGMLRSHLWRVAGVALIVFLPPAILGEIIEEVAEDIDPEADLIQRALFVGGIVLVIVLKLLGPVVYAGYLDEAVGHGYFHGSQRTFPDVIRSLPLLRLLAADVVLVVAVSAGLALLIVPGLVIATLFGLIGPVIVQERRGLIDALRRTYRISRPAWRFILILVVVPVGIEHTVAEVVLERAHEVHPIVEMAAEWLLAVTVGAAVGLIEVSIATELMARTPESVARPAAEPSAGTA